jgi:microcompartment protein CcmL/EutN
MLHSIATQGQNLFARGMGCVMIDAVPRPNRVRLVDGNLSVSHGSAKDVNVTQGVAILEITGLGPALVTLDTIEKAAPVEIVQYELNDLYGVCARLTGMPQALESAVHVARQLIESMGGTCVSTIINAPDRESAKVIHAQAEYQPLLEQEVVFFPRAEQDAATPATQGTKSMATDPNYAIGLIETQGFTAVIEAIDTACKAANVEVIGKEKLGGGYITVLIKGDVAAVGAAVEAGKAKVDGLGKLISAHVIARPSAGILKLLPHL